MEAIAVPAPDDARAIERALIVRVIQGDTTAFATLIDRHITRVTRLAVYLTGSEDAAEDIAQTVFIKLWERRAALDPDHPVRPYLLRAVHNRVIDERRGALVRAKYREYVQGAIVAGSIRTNVPSPESGILAVATVRDAIRHLSSRRRTALRLWFEEEMTAPEIAEVMDISAAAADQLVRRALVDLRNILVVSK